MQWKVNPYALHALELKERTKSNSQTRREKKPKKMHKNALRLSSNFYASHTHTHTYAANVYALAPEFSFLLALEHQIFH